jgi:hypothetical protein
MLIIFIRGFAGSGKDTLGECFTQHHGFKRFAFADALKETVSDKYNVDIAVLHSQDGKKQVCTANGKTWREILISEAAAERNKDPDVFAEMTALAIIASGAKRVVLTDWRYPNEYTIVRKLFPDALITTVHILREDQAGVSPVIDLSEYYLKDHRPDWIVHNDGKRSLLKEAGDILRAI